jgi:hypothetical protein
VKLDGQARLRRLSAMIGVMRAAGLPQPLGLEMACVYLVESWSDCASLVCMCCRVFFFLSLFLFKSWIKRERERRIASTQLHTIVQQVD